jgi:mono/diheme cytochrome c family protein
MAPEPGLDAGGYLKSLSFLYSRERIYMSLQIGLGNKRVNNTLISLVLCLLALIGCQPVQVKAQEAQAEEAIFGSKEFQKHCAACHGPEGKGDGPAAQSLKNPPPDLTLLSKQHDGRFPLDYVFKVIDGREMLSGHGTREMPIWGMRYSEDLAEGDFVKELARGRTLSLFVVGIHQNAEAHLCPGP